MFYFQIQTGRCKWIFFSFFLSFFLLCHVGICMIDLWYMEDLYLVELAYRYDRAIVTTQLWKWELRLRFIEWSLIKVFFDVRDV